MSMMDDFNRARYETARAKYRRAVTYEQLDTDDWVALTLGLLAEIESLREELADRADP